MRAFTFADRTDAGQALARALAHYDGRRDVVILALPRGGVPIGLEVARALHAPLELFIVRKLGVPMQEELAMGAIASGGTLVLNENVVKQLRITREQLDAVRAREIRELERREHAFRPIILPSVWPAASAFWWMMVSRPAPRCAPRSSP
jgi:putative phosphoribosyl transferase